MLKPRTFFFTAAAVVAALTLSSCSGGTPAAETGSASPTTTSPKDAAAFGAADVTFAQMMIPHHEQAVEMSDDLLAKDGIDPGVIDLATEIKAAQEPEITQLKEWLTQWGADEDGTSGMGGMGGESGGMMSADDMTALQNASGADASKVFLQQMTMHHQGAVAMAQIEIDDGENPDAQSLAANIVTTQIDEIAVMAELLATLE